MDISATLDSLPRLRLCQLPTPIQRMRRLEQALGAADGPALYVKRDDLTGLAFGGNKGRKLEFCLAEAQQQDADTVLTCGGVQSNHCRQTAVAATALGFEAHLFLRGERPEKLTGNLLPSALCGAEMHFVGKDQPVSHGQAMAEFAEKLRSQGRRPYVIPTGASNTTGAMGYVQAAREIKAQQDEMGVEFDWIVTATGSTGTQAGLLAGAKLFGLTGRVIGMAVSPTSDVDARRAGIATFATETAQCLGADAPTSPDEVIFAADYAGEGYAIATEAGQAALELAARMEGLFLDPTYTAKAMAGLIDHVRRGEFAASDRVLFVHTGGTIAIFA